MTDEEDRVSSGRACATCPDCGGLVAHMGGCEVCLQCGLSRCAG